MDLRKVIPTEITGPVFFKNLAVPVRIFIKASPSVKTPAGPVKN